MTSSWYISSWSSVWQDDISVPDGNLTASTTIILIMSDLILAKSFQLEWKSVPVIWLSDLLLKAKILYLVFASQSCSILTLKHWSFSLTFINISSVQEGYNTSVGSKKPTYTPPRLSDVSTTLRFFKEFQSLSDWWWPSLILLRKIVECLLFPCLSPPGDRWCDVFGFMAKYSLKLLNT